MGEIMGLSLKKMVAMTASIGGQSLSLYVRQGETMVSKVELSQTFASVYY